MEKCSEKVYREKYSEKVNSGEMYYEYSQWKSILRRFTEEMY